MRLRALAITCTVAIGLAAGTSSASAATKMWLLRPTLGTHATVGETADNLLAIFPAVSIECGTASSGTLLTNGKATDSLAFPTMESAGCRNENTGGAEPAYLVRGGITKASLKSNGTAMLKGNLIVAEPSFCVYDIKTLSGHFNITFQPQTLVTGDVTAALDKKYTLGSSCATSQVMEYRVSIFPVTEGVYKVELVG